MDRLDRMLALMRSHRPRLRLVHKGEVPWMRALGAVVRPLAPDFDSGVTTVVGDTVYLPRPMSDFDRDVLALILAHELVHQMDQRRFGPLFYLSYLMLPLPLFRSSRAYWERRAYAVDLMLAWERGGEERMMKAATRIAGLFAGPAYGWMWVGHRAAWGYLQPVMDGVRAGTLQREAPYREILSAWRGKPVPVSAVT